MVARIETPVFDRSIADIKTCLRIDRCRRWHLACPYPL